MEQGPQFTRVQYRSGGIGHVEGDETRSVVGMVPVEKLLPFREHTGNQHSGSRAIVEGIKAELKAGGAIREPVMLEYDHQLGIGSLGEGNHRLTAAVEAGQTHVPVRVHGRSRLSYRAEKGMGAPLRLQTKWKGGLGEEYIPPDIHPAHFGLT